MASVSDDNGVVLEIPDNSKWIPSDTGEIIVYSPTRNELLNSGDKISGESTLPYVNYRIIDDISGMISTGRLTVVNGKFSGTINYKTEASVGRLDIFGLNENDIEFSNVEIEVRLR
jgi:hypothetical protein